MLQSCLVCGIALIVALAVYGSVCGGSLVTISINTLRHSLGDSLLVATLVSHGAGGVMLIIDYNGTAVCPCLRFHYTILNDIHDTITPLLTTHLLHPSCCSAAHQCDYSQKP